MANKMWMVRAGRGAYAVEDFKEKGVVAVGWEKLGDLSDVKGRDQFIEMVQDAWPEMNKRQAIMSVSQIYRFTNEVTVDDRVITYDPSRRVYYVGNLKGEYRYNPNLIESFRHIRKVDWEGEVDRDKLKVATKNSLGAISTLFLIPEDAVEDIENILAGREVAEEEVEDTEEEELLKETQERSKEFIKDRINKLDWGGGVPWGQFSPFTLFLIRKPWGQSSDSQVLAKFYKPFLNNIGPKLGSEREL